MSGVHPFVTLACPLDGLALRRGEAQWQCDSGHTFDLAREGYVHLLPVQYKRSRDPGDSKEMVAARRRFLEAGGYRRIARWMREAALSGQTSGTSLNCLDAGCGEGYYLRELAADVPAETTLRLIGLDISKWAIQAAARGDRRCTWVVGSNARLPVLSGTLDRVLCLFGFPVHAEFARALKPGGRLIQIDAGPDHLRELRTVIYPVLKPEKAVPDSPPEGFELLSREALTYNLELNSQDQIADLLAMTPHLHRASPEARARVNELESLSVTVDVRLTQYVRAGGHG